MIRLLDGRLFDPFKPDAELISVYDIAASLAGQCRYAGHISRFYSVAEHSVLVSLLCSKKDALWGLLHDANEAYGLPDICTTLKCHPAIKPLVTLQENIQFAVCQKFGLKAREPKSVHTADKHIAECEKKVFWEDDPPERYNIVGHTPREAYRNFIERFRELTK